MQFGFGERDHLGNVEYVVCAGKYMSTRQAIFFKLTTAAATIRMAGLYLDGTSGDTQFIFRTSFR